MEKHITVTGISSVSWKDAIVQVVGETAKTIDYITEVKILSQRAKVNGKKLIEYYVDLDIAFKIDRDRD